MAEGRQQRNTDGDSRQIERIVPCWEFRMHINGYKKHSLLHRDDKLKAQREIYTPVDKCGHTKSKKQEVYYFIDGDKREFRTEKALIKALKETRRNYDCKH